MDAIFSYWVHTVCKSQKLIFSHKVTRPSTFLAWFILHHNISVCLSICASSHRSRWDKHDQLSYSLEETQGGGKLKAIKKRANEDRSNHCQPDAWQGGNKPSVQTYSYKHMLFQRTHKIWAEPAVLTEKMACSLWSYMMSPPVKREFRQCAQ